MEDLINRIVEQTGLSRVQATEVARLTINYIKDRLPSAEAEQVDQALIRATVGETGSYESTMKR